MPASNAALIVHDDGTLEATPELVLSLNLVPGTRMELIQQNGREVRFSMPSEMREVTSWTDLEGILADLPADPNARLDAERLAELKRDAS